MLRRRGTITVAAAVLTASLSLTVIGQGAGASSPQAAFSPQDAFLQRGDLVHLPTPLKSRLAELNRRPHTFEPMTAFAEAPSPSLLFGYYLLDTKNFQPNVFTTIIPGLNSGVIPTATGPNGDLPTIGAIRMALEPKPGLPTDPNDPQAFNDIFTDLSGLFVINNESGWYEGWMIHDVVVPQTAAPRSDDGHAQFGTMTVADGGAVAGLGGHHNVPGAVFTTDGNAPKAPSSSDHFPDRVSNLVPIQVSMGAYNALQQSDVHAYWEFNEYTNWVSPLYELPFTGGIPPAFADGQVGALQSIVPGSGPAGIQNSPVVAGDNPNNPRDPDRDTVTSLQDIDRPQPPNKDHIEARPRFVPSGLANEIMLDTYVRLASFDPGITDFSTRLFDAYAAEVARVDENHDGIVQFTEVDIEDTSDGLPNTRLYLPPTTFGRFAVTREINDGLLSPRFAPSQRAWVLSGRMVLVGPPVEASVPQDADNR